MIPKSPHANTGARQHRSGGVHPCICLALGSGSLLSTLLGLSADVRRIDGPSNYLWSPFVRITHRPRLGPSRFSPDWRITFDLPELLIWLVCVQIVSQRWERSPFGRESESLLSDLTGRFRQRPLAWSPIITHDPCLTLISHPHSRLNSGARPSLLARMRLTEESSTGH